MQQAHLETMVARLEEMAQRSPRLYRARVAAFSMIGYVVYALVLIAVIAVLAVMITMLIHQPGVWILKVGWKLGIPLVVLLFALVGALRVVVPEPRGVSLRPEDAPELFAVIDDVRRKLAVGKLHRVLLTPEYNASVTQLPRFGLFGHKSYLLLGLPLLQAHSVEDVKAVIAHELGHLSGNHSRFAGWIYRMVGSYLRLLETTGGNAPLEKFLGWYVPRLDALSFPLRRRNEYEADAASAEIVGADRTGQALTNVHVRASAEEGFWDAIDRAVFQSPDPPVDALHRWPSTLASMPESAAEHAFVASLNERTGITNTHPSLSDRLAALGVEAKREPLPRESAAERWLGDEYAAVVADVGRVWAAQVRASWYERHASITAARERLEWLAQETTTRALTVDEAFERAYLVEEFRPDLDPLPAYREALRDHPEHLPSRFALARLLLDRGDAEGVPLMREFADVDDLEVRFAANAMLARHFEAIGDERGAEESLERAREARGAHLAHVVAREQLRTDDRFLPSDLSEEQLQELRRDLEMFDQIKAAYLVRKEVEDGGLPIYVLAIELGLKALLLEDEDFGRRVVDTVTLPGETWCIRLDENPQFEAPISAIEGAAVYLKGRGRKADDERSATDSRA